MIRIIFCLVVVLSLPLDSMAQTIDDKETIEYYPSMSSFSTPFVSSNLPLLVVNTFGVDIPDEPKIEAHLGIIYNGEGNLNYLSDTFNNYNGKIGIELRGSSSLWFAKKGYGLETRLESGENNNVELLGMPKENDWVLHGPYADKSLMRNVLSYHIGNGMSSYAPRTRWCELLINDEYQGVYVLTEKIKRDKNRVDIAKLKPEDISGDEITGGYIFSVDRDDEGPGRGWRSAFTNVFYKFQDPDWDDLLQVQKDYLQNYISMFEEEISASADPSVYEKYIDVPSWIDYWIATEVFKHIDNYKFSFYMHKKKDSNGGKIHFGPLWDINLGYGNFNFVQSPDPQGWSYVWASSGVIRPTWVYTLSTDIDLQNITKCRWKELRKGVLHLDSLTQFIESSAELLEEAQTRNFERWQILGQYVWPNDFIGDTYEEEVDFLKNWLIDRIEWMDDNMLGTCMVGVDDLNYSPGRLHIAPNPFQDLISIELPDLSIKECVLTFSNTIGETCLIQEFNNGFPQTLKLGELPKGIYFYQLSIEGQIIDSGKLIKE